MSEKISLIANDLEKGSINFLETAVDFSSQIDALPYIVHADNVADPYAANASFSSLNLELRDRYLNEIKGLSEKALLGQIKAINSNFEFIKTDVFKGKASDIIVREAQNKAVELIMLGSRERKSLFDIYLGGNTESVLHRSDKSVLVVKSDKIRNTRKILVAYDFSEHCEKAIEWGERLASSLRCEVHLVNVLACFYEGFYINNSFDISQSEFMQDKIREGKESVNARLEARLKFAKFKAKDSIVAIDKTGDAAQIIADHAHQNEFDLIIAGSHQRGAIGEFFMGSVVNQLLKKSSVSVLVAK